MNGEKFQKARAEDLLLAKLAVQQQVASKELVSSLLKRQKELWEKEQKLVRVSDLLRQSGQDYEDKLAEVESLFLKNFKVCDNCYTPFNVESFPDGKKFKCKKCGAVLTVERKVSRGAQEEEVFTFEQVQEYLCIDQKELGLIISSGELKGFLDGNVMKFRKSDVEKVKKFKEIQPTMILDGGDTASGTVGKAATESSSSGVEDFDTADEISLDEKMTMKEVLSTLQIDEGQLRKMMALGELIPSYESGEALFSKEQVLRVKGLKEAQPTMILTNMRVDQSLSGEQLISFEEAMDDLGLDAQKLQELIAAEGIHPIGRGDREFYRTSDIALLRSKLRERQRSGSASIHKLSARQGTPIQTSRGAGGLLSFEEVVQKLRCSAKEVRQLIQQGRLKPIMEGDTLRFRCEDVEKLAQEMVREGGEERGAPSQLVLSLLGAQGEKKRVGESEVWELSASGKTFWLLSHPEEEKELILVERSAFQAGRNFALALVAAKGTWKVRRTGAVGDKWILLGREDQPVEVLPRSQAQLLGYVVARVCTL